MAFKVEVEKTIVDVMFADNGSFMGRKQLQPDGAVEFNEGRGDSMWRLECRGDKAKLTIPADEYTAARVFPLTKVQRKH